MCMVTCVSVRIGVVRSTEYGWSQTVMLIMKGRHTQSRPYYIIFMKLVNWLNIKIKNHFKDAHYFKCLFLFDNNHLFVHSYTVSIIPI